jgi:Uma2 family endonuclease
MRDLNDVEQLEKGRGGIRLMAGGTDNHNVIKMDLSVYLGSHARRYSDCEPCDSDAAVYIPKSEAYVFTDLLFVCDEVSYQDEDRRRLMNPTLVFEVLSESAENYDRGGKFQKYRSLESFREYVLVDSQRYAVECFYKEQPKVWRIDSWFDPSSSVYIHTLDVHVPLADIYRRASFNAT